MTGMVRPKLLHAEAPGPPPCRSTTVSALTVPSSPLAAGPESWQRTPRPATSAMRLVDSASRAIGVIELLRVGPADRSQHGVRGHRQAAHGAPIHRQRPLRVVDRVHPPCVSVPPEPLDRRTGLQRPAAGVLE